MIVFVDFFLHMIKIFFFIEKMLILIILFYKTSKMKKKYISIQFELYIFLSMIVQFSRVWDTLHVRNVTCYLSVYIKSTVEFTEIKRFSTSICWKRFKRQYIFVVDATLLLFDYFRLHFCRLLRKMCNQPSGSWITTRRIATPLAVFRD